MNEHEVVVIAHERTHAFTVKGASSLSAAVEQVRGKLKQETLEQHMVVKKKVKII